MDIVLILQIVVLLGSIFIGIRLGGIGVGYAGGIGVVILGLCLGMKPGGIPWDVILIIMSVIAAISAMQLAGGSPRGASACRPRRATRTDPRSGKCRWTAASARECGTCARRDRDGARGEGRRAPLRTGSPSRRRSPVWTTA